MGVQTRDNDIGHGAAFYCALWRLNSGCGENCAHVIFFSKILNKGRELSDDSETSKVVTSYRMMTEGFSTHGSPDFISASPQSPACSFKRVAPLKIKFTPEEDAKLLRLVQQHGARDWIRISQHMGTRNPRQCRERFKNYINPDLRKDQWTPEEDKILEEKFAEYGAKWNKISRFFVNRSDNNIRNRWMMIARHRSKVTTSSPKPPVQKDSEDSVSPISPPPQPHHYVTPIVMPVVKELAPFQMGMSSESLDVMSLPIQEEFDFFGDNQSDMWSQFSFF